MYRTVKRYLETGSIQKRKGGGRPRPVRTPAMVKALRERIHRNPCRSQKKMALQVKTSKETMRRALK